MAQKRELAASQLRPARFGVWVGDMSESLSPEAAARDALRQYYAAFNAGDWGGMLGLLTEDVVHDVNQGGRERGREAFGAFLERMRECYAEQVEDLVLWADVSGTRAAAEFTVLGRYLQADAGLPPAKGQEYRLAAGAFFALREGRVARVTLYYNLEEWLRQVGAGGSDGEMA